MSELPGFQILESGPLRVARHRLFDALGGAPHFFTLRNGRGEFPEPVPLLALAGLGGRELAFVKQVHGAKTCEATRALERVRAADPVPSDALFGSDPGIALGVRTADCVPILLADPDGGTVAAVHAGWRGTLAGVAPKAVEAISGHRGAAASRLVALLGPAIGSCCYEVRNDVAGGFDELFPRDEEILRREGEGWRLGLPAANARLLIAAGMDPERVLLSGACTSCRLDLFPSYRRQGAGAGRLWSLIAPAFSSPTEPS